MLRLGGPYRNPKYNGPHSNPFESPNGNGPGGVLTPIGFKTCPGVQSYFVGSPGDRRQ